MKNQQQGLFQSDPAPKKNEKRSKISHENRINLLITALVHTMDKGEGKYTMAV